MVIPLAPILVSVVFVAVFACLAAVAAEGTR